MSEYYNFLQYWPYALLMIVFVSWALYHFVAPANQREWVGAGLLQAFGLDIPLVHASGHLWGALLGFGAAGALIEMALGFSIMLAGVLLIVKGWVGIYFSADHLITSGVYGLMRHPQYTGIFLVILGQLIHWPTVVTLLLAPIVVAVYVRLARREEAQLIATFGDAYQRYRQRVPMFVPRWAALKSKLAGA